MSQCNAFKNKDDHDNLSVSTEEIADNDIQSIRHKVNEAVKRCRRKKNKPLLDGLKRIAQLKAENIILKQSIGTLRREINLLKMLYIEHVGMPQLGLSNLPDNIEHNDLTKPSSSS